MSQVECWHPIESLQIVYHAKTNDITAIICRKCGDDWTVVKGDRLVSYIERFGDDYAQVRRDSSGAQTVRPYVPTPWELHE